MASELLGLFQRWFTSNFKYHKFAVCAIFVLALFVYIIIMRYFYLGGSVTGLANRNAS